MTEAEARTTEPINEADVLLDTRGAARFLSVSMTTLVRYRKNGGGPESVRVGKRAVRYRLSSLRAFLKAVREGEA